MRNARDAMQDVVLLDAPESDGSPELAEGSPAEAARDARSRRVVRTRWGVLTALALAFALPAASQSWLAPVVPTRLAGVPGLVVPLDGPVRELWTEKLPMIGPDSEVGGVLVGSMLGVPGADTASGVGIGTAQGVDARTGAQLWSVPLEVHGNGYSACVTTGGSVAGPGRAVLVCKVVDEDIERTNDDGSTWYQPTRTHLAVIEPATGRVIRELRVDPNDSFEALRADIAVAAMEETGVVVTRIDPRTGRTVWSNHHAMLPGDSPGNALVQRSGTGLIITASYEAWSLSAQGRPVREWDERSIAGKGWSLQEHPGGHTLLWSFENDGSGSATMADLETGVTISAPSGTYPVSGVDDGSVPGLLLTRGPGLTAYDLATGKVRWQSPGPVDDLLVLDGVVYVVGIGSVRAQDATTGEVLWDRRTSFVGFDRIATDGRSLLVLDPPKDDRSTLVALDLRDGSVQWKAPLAHVAENLLVLADHLFIQDADGRFTALG